MFNKKKKDKKGLGPVMAIMLLIALIILTSAIFSLLGITGTQTTIVNGSLETSLTTVNNILTKEGIKYIFTNAVTNIQIFQPLVLFIISLMAVSIGESSGLFHAIFSKFKNIKPKFCTFITLLLGIIASFFGEYSYIFLFPLSAVFYQTIGRKPMLGILATFLGITIGYGAGVVCNGEGILLATFTQSAAAIDVDPSYVYNLSSNIYIMIFSTLILSIVGTYIIHGVYKKIPKTIIEESDKKVSKKALHYTTLAFAVMMLMVLYAILPGFNGSGVLLGEGNSYLEKLLNHNSPFYTGFSLIILAIMMVCSVIYGYISGNIKNTSEYSVGLSKNFEGLGYVFVLLFFTAQMIGILEWTNLGVVIATNLVSFISSLSMTGILLILLLFITIVIMSILIPSAELKWGISAPLIVPLLMRANITPSFAQFIFRAADGVGKAMTPFFAYYIIMLAFLEKYNNKGDEKVTIFETLKMLMPSILLFAGLWILILICWYLMGLPTGPNVYPTF